MVLCRQVLPTIVELGMKRPGWGPRWVSCRSLILLDDAFGVRGTKPLSLAFWCQARLGFCWDKGLRLDIPLGTGNFSLVPCPGMPSHFTQKNMQTLGVWWSKDVAKPSVLYDVHFQIVVFCNSGVPFLHNAFATDLRNRRFPFNHPKTKKERSISLHSSCVSRTHFSPSRSRHVFLLDCLPQLSVGRKFGS